MYKMAKNNNHTAYAIVTLTHEENLTPLLFFLAIIWDVVVGECDRIIELALCLGNSSKGMSGAASHCIIS